MEGKPGTRTVFGIEIPAEQRTPVVEALLRVIEQLQEEIRRLKGLPETPKRPPQPSSLNDPSSPPSTSAKKKPTTPNRKRPGSATRSKTKHVVIHDALPLPLDGLAYGASFLDYHVSTVQQRTA